MLKSKQFTDEEWLALPEVERQAHLRLDREFEAYRQRQDAQARAKGFANREEEHAWMFQQREKKLTEYCASRGITREQHMKEMKAKAARRRQKYDRGPNPVKDFAHCKCKEHLLPTFCPEALTGFKTQKFHPIDLARMQEAHRINPSQLHSLAKAPSKRLPEDLLEHACQADSQLKPSKMPFWASWDDVVQQIQGKALPRGSSFEKCGTRYFRPETPRISIDDVPWDYFVDHNEVCDPPQEPPTKNHSSDTSSSNEEAARNREHPRPEVSSGSSRAPSLARKGRSPSRGRQQPRTPSKSRDKVAKSPSRSRRREISPEPPFEEGIMARASRMRKSRSLPPRLNRKHDMAKFTQLAAELEEWKSRNP